MTTVQDLAEEIVAREGGFVNDPADLGGATNESKFGGFFAFRQAIGGPIHHAIRLVLTRRGADQWVRGLGTFHGGGRDE